MIALVLVRHAKSDWSDPSLADHDRPLNGRGEANAPMMASRFVAAGHSVDRIFTSTALRARTTAAAFSEATGVPLEPDAGLYLSSPATIWAKAEGAGVDTVMIVAHDPGITQLAFDLSDGGIGHMPTGAVARFQWEGDDWPDQHSPRPTWSLDTPRGPRTATK